MYMEKVSISNSRAVAMILVAISPLECISFIYIGLVAKRSNRLAIKSLLIGLFVGYAMEPVGVGLSFIFCKLCENVGNGRYSLEYQSI